MRKLVNGKKCTQMILIVIIAMLIFNFIIPNYSQADAGGVLLKPITDLFSLLGDAICGALQMFLVDGEFFPTEGSILSGFLASSEGFNAADYDMEYNDSSGDVEVHKFYTDQIDLEGWDWWPGNDSVAIPVAKYTPDSIFAGLIPALDINFINPKVWEETEENERSVTQQLHKTIATWYVALRNLAVVGLMVILVYVGIRMILSSTASDKAKYKQMMMDWLVAMCILFCLHYIMSFTITITEEITKAINGATGSVNTIPVVVYEGDNTSTTELVKFNTNLTGLARFQTKMDDGGTRLIYTIIYMALVIYTCMFTFTYLKRVITMAFLTLIAPLVALTYPIDKMNDGKAQAFNSWLKEYIFNALLQPFHLIIYTVLVASAMNLAATNPIYAIVALAFITPAEKILRKFFGFEKASTAGTLGAAVGVAGGAAFMNVAKGLMAPKKGSGGSGGKAIKTKGGVKGSTPSVGDAFGNGTSTGAAIEAKSQEKDDKTSTNSFGGEMSDNDYIDYQMGAYDLEKGENSSIASPTSPSVPSSSSSFEINDSPIPTTSSLQEKDIQQERQGAFAWSEDDTRGMGQWIGDAAKYGANWVGENTKIGRGTVRLGRKLGDGSRSIRDQAKYISKRTGEKVARIPKPIRNTARTLGNAAKGVGNVALQSGVATGKAVLKAAPGAMLGLAAGIAGDDLGDIWKYTAAGAALSSTIGSSSVAQAGSFVAEAYKQGAHGDVESQLAQRRKNFEKDESNQLLAESMYPEASKAEIKKRMKQASYYDSVGIEGKDAFKAVKLEEKLKQEMMNQGKAENDSAKLAQKQAAVIADIAKDYSKKDLKDKDEVMNLRTDLSSKLKKAGLKGTELSSTVEHLVTEVKTFKGVNNNY